MKRQLRRNKNTKCMTKTLSIDVKIDLFLKTNLNIEMVSTRKKYDVKELFHIIKTFF